MPTGSDGHDDEELLLEELEPELDAEDVAVGPATAPRAPALPQLPPAAITSSPDAPAFDEAAAEDARADAALFAAEAAAEGHGDRRAALWLEVARLEEAALGDGEPPILRAAREAFAAAPSFAAAFGPLRRLLAARGLWEELVGAYDAALAGATLAPDDRADLLVERGVLLEDRLGARRRTRAAATPRRSPRRPSMGPRSWRSS